MGNLPALQRGSPSELVTSDLLRRSEDAAAMALQRRTGGRWLCWFGRATGRYWAMPRPPYPWWGLVEGAAPGQLLAAMTQIELVYGRAP